MKSFKDIFYFSKDSFEDLIRTKRSLSLTIIMPSYKNYASCYYNSGPFLQITGSVLVNYNSADIKLWSYANNIYKGLSESIIYL